MAGSLYQCFIHPFPFVRTEINQTRKFSFNYPPSFHGTQISYTRLSINVNQNYWAIPNMCWVIPKMQHNASPLVGFSRFSREKEKPAELVAGSDTACRAPKLLKRALAVLMALSCAAAFLCRCRAAYAVDNIPSPNYQQLLANMKALWRLFWPKILQIVTVFRDHGLIIFALLCLSAFFSMAETSIMTLWPWKVQELAEKEPEDGVFRLLRQDVTRFLTTILIGTTVVNIGATALVTEAATALFGEAGISAATGVMTVVILLLTEITPKSLAVHNATEVARFVVRPVAWISLVLYPVGRVFTALSMGMLKILGLKSRSEPLVTEDELKLMLRGAELSGAIEEEEQDMIENVLDFKGTDVRKVMTPLVDVVAIDVGATLMDFRDLWLKYQYSRVPVFELRIDNIVGIAYAMDMLDYVEQTELLERLTVGHLAHRPAYFVPDSMSIWRLLREFRIRKVHMAVVLNEYGGTVGIVTLEDVVEEIFEESDSKEEIQNKTDYIVQRAEGVYDVDANTSIEDLEEALGVKVAEGPYQYETVSGFVCRAFGYIPRTGQSIDIVLDKGNLEESENFGENGVHQDENQQEKFQKYKLEILAGNARKVGTVRFEEVKDDKVNHVDSQTEKQSWEVVCETDDDNMQSNQETSLDTNVIPSIFSKNGEIPDSVQVGSPNHHVIAENDDIDDQSKPQLVDVSELTVTSPDNVTAVEDIDIHVVDDINVHSTKTSSENWKQDENKGDRKKRKRRKQSPEDSVDLESEHSVDWRHETN
ncbi:hypothetical protein SUGI_0255580 [Cryptomeria japonica]|uniref:putative DUF21 domain-containing protein At3g13070, chloroplastic n=1 Tax=Cryptomeria japonica TaxID=3369 RepID=UPI002408D538|nr:putative DUF21 domain-containing protein At3g13070, chloroplastic [Cryptomeria japonica]GLJ15559.1 hypothetical protein SUGI_0255580 [Cryptomeria japonica]